MSESVVLPALGESVTEGTVTRWLKNIGDTVEVDEPLLEVSTDKVDTEVPSPIAGVLEEILVQEDETAEVGAVLARVGDGSGSEASSETSETVVDETGTDEPASEKQEEDPEPPTEEKTQVAKAPNGSSGGEAIRLPSLGESITEGTVTRWLKSVGDSVDVDEPLLEVSTDKVDTEVPSPVAGVLQEILVQEDETVQVGGDLAIVGSGAKPEPEPASKPEPESKPQSEPKPDQKPQAESRPEPEQKPEPQRGANQAAAAQSGYLTPIVRKLANDLNVDLSRVGGTGVGGRIRKEDVLAAHRARPQAESTASKAPVTKPEVSPLRGTTEKMSRLRKVIAERAVASLHQTAQLTTVVEVDVTRVARLRDAKKAEFLEKTGDKLSFMPFFAVAAAEALRAYPIINSTVEGDSVVYPESENISIAVDTERGLLTPVLRDAGDKNIAELASEIADLAARTRDNQLKPDELAGGTFTLTNTGSRGALFDTPLVFLPQSAILGTGAVVKKPAVVSTPEGDAIAVRQTVYLALSYDHRTVDGADAARFLTQMKQRLEEGAFEEDLGI